MATRKYNRKSNKFIKTRSKKGGEKPVDTVDECPICFEPMDNVKDLDSLETTGCTHTFHKNCLKRWCSTDCACPICRGRIPNTCAKLTNYKALCGGKRKTRKKNSRGRKTPNAKRGRKLL